MMGNWDLDGEFAEFDRVFEETRRSIHRAFIAAIAVTVAALGLVAWVAVTLIQWVTR